MLCLLLRIEGMVDDHLPETANHKNHGARDLDPTRCLCRCRRLATMVELELQYLQDIGEAGYDRS